MNNELIPFMSALDAYLEMPKAFMQNPERIKDVVAATETTKALFPDATIYIKNDPLQLGALILCIEDYDITVRGVTEMEAFNSITANASNFEIYSKGNDRVQMSVLFDHALIRIKQNP